MFSSFAVAELSACSDVCVPQQCKSYYSEKGPQCQHIFSNIFNYFLESVIFPVFTAYTGIANRSDSAKSDSFFQNAVSNYKIFGRGDLNIFIGCPEQFYGLVKQGFHCHGIIRDLNSLCTQLFFFLDKPAVCLPDQGRLKYLGGLHHPDEIPSGG